MLGESTRPHEASKDFSRPRMRLRHGTFRSRQITKVRSTQPWVPTEALVHLSF